MQRLAKRYRYLKENEVIKEYLRQKKKMRE